ncbi:MAG TPA: hypothetical protein VK053_08420, partial [Jiangellaceae bacterium]|nr:hypothetical protein [Jiangellaceae bacterium]
PVGCLSDAGVTPLDSSPRLDSFDEGRQRPVAIDGCRHRGRMRPMRGRHPLKRVPSSMTWSGISPVAGGLGCTFEHHRIRRVKSAFFLVSMRV